MTPQTQFTPGPWKWVGTQGNPELFAYLGNPNHEHDYVFVNLSGFKPTPENARLIASAPEMYSALESLVEAAETVCDCGECRGCLITAIGREVLNKAIGR